MAIMEELVSGEKLVSVKKKEFQNTFLKKLNLKC